MRNQKYISYVPGSSSFSTAETDPHLGLRVPDAKVKARLNNVRDMILFRLGSTGVYEVRVHWFSLLALTPSWFIVLAPFQYSSVMNGAASSQYMVVVCYCWLSGYP